jgi:cytochrome oxidase assembly protein ShyY1
VSARRPRVARVAALILLGLLLGGACGAAGVWQWHRFGQKKSADDELRAAARQPVAPLDEVLAPGRPVDDAIRFRTVTATGRYDAAQQLLVRQRQVDDRPGFLVLTPLQTTSGRTLYVDRGFVPVTGAATQTPNVPDPPAGQVQVTGRILPSEQGGLGDGLPARQIERIDVPGLAARDGVRAAYPAYVELISSTPAQQGLVALPPPDLTNPAGGAYVAQHLAYVVQWFLFSAFALAGPVVLLLLDRRARRREPGPRPEPAATAAPTQAPTARTAPTAPTT